MSSPDNTPNALVFRSLPEQLVAFLRLIPDCQDLGTDLAEGRLFPPPCGNAEASKQVHADWKSYVEPELRQQFQTSREIVASDLANMVCHKDGGSLAIPLEHFDPWLNALNQIRLAIAATHNLTEDELSGDTPPPEDSGRAQQILRVHFYGYLQQSLIDAAGL